MKYKLSPIFKGSYPVSQRYGARPEYYAQFGLAGHEGIDYATPSGTTLLAPFDGIIVRDIDDPKSGSYGIYLVVFDPVQKCAVWYCHLQANDVGNGQQVKRGQVIGRTGNSGNSSGPHLHMNFVETDANGNRLNTNNGFQGFLDPDKYIEWITNSPTPQPPMTIDSERKKSTQVDDILIYLKEQKYIESDDSNKYLNGEFKTLIVTLYEKFVSNRKRAGEFDKICRALGISGDTNIVTANMILAIAKEKYQGYDEQTVREDERQKYRARIIQAINEIA